MLIKHTYEFVNNFIKSKNCDLLSKEYINNLQELNIKCNCGTIFKTTFMRFYNKNKQQCHNCSKVCYDIDFVRNYINEHDCKLLSTEYINGSQKLDLLCSCGEQFQTTFLNFKLRNKIKCNKCSIGRVNNAYLTLDEVTKYLELNNLKLLSDYKKSNEKLKILCTCGDIFYASFNKIKSSNQIRCNKCTKSMSKIEILTESFLKINNVKFDKQYKFKDLKTRYNVYLRFDFVIYDNQDIKLLLELDGEQHFKSVERFGGESEYLNRLKNDNLKNEYCSNNNINLIRIPYWKFNKINEELTKILKIS